MRVMGCQVWVQLRFQTRAVLRLQLLQPTRELVKLGLPESSSRGILYHRHTRQLPVLLASS
jgi:hypothetical protein